MALVRARSGLVAVLFLSPLTLAAQVPGTEVSTGDVGKHTGIVVDATNSAHIIYYDATNKDIRSVWRSGIWYSGTVDGVGDVGEYGSIAIIPNPLLKFVSYYDGGNQYLKLAHQTTAGATTYAIEHYPLSVRLAARTSLALNLSYSTPIIAFFDLTDHQLKLALFDLQNQFGTQLSSPPWGVETVAGPLTNVEDLAFVLDNGRNPHLAYIEVQNTGTAVLRYAYKPCLASGCLSQIDATHQTGQGTFQIETVPNTGPVGFSVALALDPTTGNPLIAYYANGQLKYAVRSGNTWLPVVTVDQQGDVGKYVSIALATNGDPHLAYYDATNGDLKHAIRTGGNWTATTLDATGNVGQYTSIAIGPDNIERISYYDVTNADLKYYGPARFRRDCNGQCGPVIGGIVIPLVIAAFWRRRVARERP